MSAPPRKVSHGFLSARHWQDIRQACRLARTEGAHLIVHGVPVSPAGYGKDRGGNPHRPRSARAETPVRDDSSKHPPENAPKSTSKKDRDTRRYEEFRKQKGVVVRWEHLCRKMLSVLHFHNRSFVWTEWMKAKPLKQAVQTKFPRGAVVATGRGGDPDGFGRSLLESTDDLQMLNPQLVGYRDPPGDGPRYGPVNYANDGEALSSVAETENEAGAEQPPLSSAATSPDRPNGSKIDPNSLKVSELRARCKALGVDTSTLLEKHDFVSAILSAEASADSSAVGSRKKGKKKKR